MKFRLTFRKKQIVIASVLTAATFAGVLLGGGWMQFAVGLAVLVAFVTLASVEVHRAVYVLLLQAAMSLVSVTLLQLVLGLYINDLGLATMCLNWLLSAAVSFLILAVCGNIKLTNMIWTGILLAFGLLDAFVILYRGNQISINDIFSVSTAVSVSGNYQLKYSVFMVYAGIIAAAQFVFLLRSSFVKVRIPWRLGAVGFAAACLAAVLLNMGSYVVHTWNNQGCTKNGTLLEFALELRDSYISAPDGYSGDEVTQIAEQYTDTAGFVFDSGTITLPMEKPNILVIMSESYSDLSMLGNLETNIDPAPYFQEIWDTSIHGYASSSVYGANTANSEWEFLTGNSMAFLPSGSVVYQQYISGETNSLVSVLKNLGYSAVSMHPYYATGWDRTNIYQYLGFDESYFIDDFDQAEILRSYITDEEFYSKITDYFDSKTAGDPLFMFGISMQNHGGYTKCYDNFVQRVHVTNLETEYPDVNQYLSLVRESDDALKNLIRYFKNYDEDTVIVFFGDHQPKLNAEFYTELNPELDLIDTYKIPFFIWANYDLETTCQAYDITSINYLSTILMDAVGIDAPAYYDFLDSMSEDIQAVSSQGFYSDGVFKTLAEADETERTWLDQYWILEYANMFDSQFVGSSIFNGISIPNDPILEGLLQSQ